jgi:predicted sugar kinase
VGILVDEPNLRVELTTDGLFHVQVSESGENPGVDESARPAISTILDTIQVQLEKNARVDYMIGLSGITDLTLAERWQIAERRGAGTPP